VKTDFRGQRVHSNNKSNNALHCFTLTNYLKDEAQSVLFKNRVRTVQ